MAGVTITGVPISMWVREELPGRSGRLREGKVPWKPPHWLLNQRDTPLLVAVDSYGDTVFNRFQCREQLPREIAYLREHLDGDTHAAMLDELERLVATTTEGVHRYLWFVGN